MGQVLRVSAPVILLVRGSVGPSSKFIRALRSSVGIMRRSDGLWFKSVGILVMSKNTCPGPTVTWPTPSVFSAAPMNFPQFQAAFHPAPTDMEPARAVFCRCPANQPKDPAALSPNPSHFRPNPPDLGSCQSVNLKSEQKQLLIEKRPSTFPHFQSSSFSYPASSPDLSLAV